MAIIHLYRQYPTKRSLGITTYNIKSLCGKGEYHSLSYDEKRSLNFDPTITTCKLCLKFKDMIEYFDFKVGDKVIFRETQYHSSHYKNMLNSTGSKYFEIMAIYPHVKRQGGVAYRLKTENGNEYVNIGISGYSLVHYKDFNCEILPSMRNTIHYADFDKVKFTGKFGDYHIESRCGTLRRKYDGHVGINGWVVAESFTKDPLKITCSICQKLCSELIKNINMKNSIHYCKLSEIPTWEKGDEPIRVKTYKVTSLCGMLIRDFDGKEDIDGDEVQKRFTEDTEKVQCPRCRQLLQNPESITPAYQDKSDIERDKLMAKEIAKHVNSFLSSNHEFTLGGLRNGLSKVKCKYYSQVVSMLKNKQLIIYSRLGVDERGIDNMNLYKKAASEPIYYTHFLDVVQNRRIDYSISIPSKTPSIKEALKGIQQPVSESILPVKDVINQINKKRDEINVSKQEALLDTCNRRLLEIPIDKWEDKWLVEELRLRGYTVSATKTIEL